MRVPVAAVVAGTVVALLGAAGLVRGAMPVSAGGSAHTSTPSGVPAIVVTGAYVRPPVPPNDEAAAYFIVRNTTDRADVLQSVLTGAGASAELHTVQPDGSMAVAATGVPIPAHGSVTLAPGKGHVMIDGVYGTLSGGQTVNLELTFRDYGPLEVTAVVVPWSQPAPDSPATSPTPSGAHS